jgi:hypothetical protein
MQLEQALESVVGFVVPSEFGRFREHVDRAWIEEALWATGSAGPTRRSARSVGRRHLGGLRQRSAGHGQDRDLCEHGNRRLSGRVIR